MFGRTKFIAEGHPVTVLPVKDEIGTQEAADMLQVSRPYLVKLLDTKALPSRKVGGAALGEGPGCTGLSGAEKAARMKVLEELAAEGQRLNLGE
jgi:excisionase family DNA binding protein